MYQEGDTYEVPADVFSVFHKRQYAAKGDLVKVISVHGVVLILEDKNGFRFPLAAAYKSPPQIIEKKIPETTNPPTKKKPIIRSVPIQEKQQSLF
jgi:hypothetical protein